MPALFATCQECGYKFAFDYDLRQQRCSKCYKPFDWKGNPQEGGSFHADGGATASGDSGRGDSPVLPGEAGHAEYEASTRKRHSGTITETDRPEKYWK